ncbi:MAG: hypothetical protein NT062_25600, partial [Proteobacteria bacterium]|nr:hypothetical protein [Pseudomonadota bacterium]
LALVARSSTMSVVDAAPPEPRPLGDVQVGDSVTRIGVDERGPITICVLPGAVALPDEVAFHLTPGPDTMRPACVSVTMPSDGVIIQR